MTVPTRIFVALALLANIAVGLLILWGLLALVVPPLRRALKGFARGMRDSGAALWLAWLAASVATGGSLYFSEVLGWIPCALCWFERICMYPLVVILLIGAIRRARDVAWYAIAFPIVGSLITVRHIYIEVNPDAETAACKIGGGGCATPWIDDALGYLTVPRLALSAFVFIIAMLLLTLPWGRLWPRRAAGSTDASADYVIRRD